MEQRTLPLVTFVCAKNDCGEQVTIRVNEFHRVKDKPDFYEPWPKHHKKPMKSIQIDYWAVS